LPILLEWMMLLSETAIEVRKVSHNLMPTILAKYGLEETLEIYCENISSASALEIDLQFHGNLMQIGKHTELILYRIIQELIQNIIKHAKATDAAIQIRAHDDKISIIVEDNGPGFDLNEDSDGLGLQNLRFRVQALRGEIFINSAKEAGTTVCINFDLEKLNTIS